MKNKKFWICGKHTVLEVIKSKKKQIFEVLINEKNKQELQYLKQKIKNINIVNDKFISKKIKNFSISHQGYAALVSNSNNSLNTDGLEKFNTIIALDGVTDSRNIGSIIRTCAAFKVDGIIVKDRSFNEESLSMNKTACGGTEKINIFKVPNIKYLIEILKKNNFKIISLSVSAKSIITPGIFGKKNVFIFGSEDKGIGSNLINKSDEVVRINTSNDESLNVSNSVSATLAIYHFLNSSGK